MRHRRLPATGLPPSRDSRRGSAILSLVLHALLIAFLIVPMTVHHEIIEKPQGAGGPGPAGGGGGGRRGSGGDAERLQYLELASPAPAPVVAPIVPPPVPAPAPVVPPPVLPALTETPKPELRVEAPKVTVTAPTPGVGGGTGHDGSMGSGPGSGGGVGSGVGTGRGSGTGPGTGGGAQANYPPSPTELFIPPLPMPDKVRGFHLVAEYDIDETGRIVAFDFTPTRDRDYNKRLEEVLRSFRFRPGTRPDGTPIRMKAQIVYDF